MAIYLQELYQQAIFFAILFKMLKKLLFINDLQRFHPTFCILGLI